MRTSLHVTGKTERTMYENRTFYPALDGIRAIAFLLVFFQHYYSIPWGWAGVNIFFVLSGFLITGILYDSRDDAHRARNFYIRRTLRIFPLYYGVFVILLLLDPIFHWHWSIAWLAWPLYIANYLRFISPSVLTTGSTMQLASYAWLRSPLAPQATLFLGHFWSLCVEEQFYLIWPWVVFSVRKSRALLWICGIVVVLVPLLRLIAQNLAPSWMLQANLLDCATPFQLDSLLLGGLVALLLRGPYRKRILDVGTIIAPCAIFLSTILLAAGIASSYPNWRFGYIYPAWKFTWGLTIVNLLAAGTILCVLRPFGVIYRFLSLRVLRRIGRISYGAYIFHDIFHVVYRVIVAVIGSYFRFVANNAEEFVLLLGLTCTLLISELSFEYFESVFINLKERWTFVSDQPAVQRDLLS